MRINDMSRINAILENILAGYSKEDIIKDIKNIRSLCECVVRAFIAEEHLDQSFIEFLVQEALGKILIHNTPFQTFEMYHEKTPYKKGYEQETFDPNDKLKVYPQKKVRVIIDGVEHEILVFDTGDEYIPVYPFDNTYEEVLKQLKENERIQKLIDLLDSVASIHLDYETKEKIKRELEKRKQKDDNTLDNEDRFMSR